MKEVFTKIIGLVCLLMISFAHVQAQQDSICIYQKGNTLYKRNINQIDSIRYAKQSGNNMLHIYSNGNVIYNKAVKDIDSIAFNYESTPSTGQTVRDIDGNTYQSVIIGNQEWLSSNLKTTKYRNRDLIGTTVPLGKNLDGVLNPKYQWPAGGDEANVKDYGRLYTHDAAMDRRGICPTGWRLPTINEFGNLVDYLGGMDVTPQKIMATGNSYWKEGVGTNTSGFDARGSGYRYDDGSFSGVKEGAVFTISSEKEDSGTPQIQLLLGQDDRVWDISGLLLHFMSDGDERAGKGVRCIKDVIEKPSKPLFLGYVSADPLSTSAQMSAEILSEGSSPITQKGVCWSTSANPTINDHKMTTGTPIDGYYEYNLEGLSPSTSYYLRSFATNAQGTMYGNMQKITTEASTGQTVRDIDGNTYQSVIIGDQEWLSSNLKTTKYRNGNVIGTTTKDISTESSPKYQWPVDGKEANVADYGRLYTWYAANDSRGICPTGWRIPSINEYGNLVDYLGGMDVAGGKLKASGTLYWRSPNNVASNSSGFDARGSGKKYRGSYFTSFQSETSWWSSSNPIFLEGGLESPTAFVANDMTMAGFSGSVSMEGESIRCIKDVAEKPSKPIVTGSIYDVINSNSAVFILYAISEGSSPITQKGVCWSTSANPTINDHKMTIGTSREEDGYIEYKLTNLSPSTTYYARSFATNAQGTWYGFVSECTTPPASASNTTITVNGHSFEMVYVKEGSFVMGCSSEVDSDCQSNEKPEHRVELSSYHIGKFEVTQGLWKAVMGAANNPSYYRGDRLPVENVSWHDCQSFISELNRLTGKTFALPTEAQWEYAAIGGPIDLSSYKYSGSHSIGNVAWYDQNSGSKTHEVGGKQANVLGIYDMSGNVWEWCRDWYGDYTAGEQTNPSGPTSGSLRVVRGGSLSNGSQDCRVSFRGSESPGYRDAFVGFRLALVQSAPSSEDYIEIKQTNTWLDGNLTGEGKGYKYTATEALECIQLYWDDGYAPNSGTKNLDVAVSVVNMNGETTIFRVDRGYETPINLGLSAGEYVYIIVEPYTIGGSGTFALYLSKVNSIPSTPLTINDGYQGQNKIYLSWNQDPDAAYYAIYHSTAQNGEYTSEGYVKGIATMLLKPSSGANYYKVVSFSPCGVMGAESPAKYVYFQALSQTLVAPIITDFTEIGFTEDGRYYFNVSWTAVPRAESYDVYVSENGGEDYYYIDNTSESYMGILTRPLGATSYFKVKALNSGEESAFSEIYGVYIPTPPSEQAPKRGKENRLRRENVKNKNSQNIFDPSAQGGSFGMIKK